MTKPKKSGRVALFIFVVVVVSIIMLTTTLSLLPPPPIAPTPTFPEGIEFPGAQELPGR